jgi:hypothetical protein
MRTYEEILAFIASENRTSKVRGVDTLALFNYRERRTAYIISIRSRHTTGV